MLGHVLTVLEHQPQLWEEYIKHFLCLKCHIRDFENPTVTSVITMQFGPVLATKDIKKRLARLQYETFVEPRDLAIFSPSPLSPVLGRGTEEDIIPSLFGVFLSDSVDDECVDLVDRMKKLQLWHSIFLEYVSTILSHTMTDFCEHHLAELLWFTWLPLFRFCERCQGKPLHSPTICLKWTRGHSEK